MVGAGARLGPYEVLAPLGAGGMGEVYRARDTRLGRDVAIKVLPPHLAGNPDADARFHREARAISGLNHPNICTLHDVGHENGTHYLVMEVVEGETLTARLRRGPLPLAELLRYGAQVAEALDAAHRHGIVHRDLKPGNIMLTKAGAKLMDFGLSRGTGLEAEATDLTHTPTVSRTLTAEGTLVGTFLYMAPEQLEGKEADARSDLWALGCVLYEMAVGQRAFDGTSQASLISSIMKDEPRSMVEIQPLVPPVLERTVRQCLAKDPEERWQSAGDLRRELAWIGQELSGAGGKEFSAPARSRARSRGRPWDRIVATGALLVALGLAAALFLKPAPPVRAVRLSILPPVGVGFSSTADTPTPIAVSPDGSQIAFCARQGEGPNLLWVRALDSDEPRAIVGTEGASMPFWSPDSRSLGFFAGYRLKRVDAQGGPVTTLARAPDGRGGSWSRNGMIIFTPDFTGAVFSVPADGGSLLAVTALDTTLNEVTHRFPSFLPDGEHFIYLARRAGVGAGDEPTIYAGELGSANRTPLIVVASNVIYASGHLLYVRQGVLVAQPFDARRLKTTGAALPVVDDVRMDERFSRGVFSASQNGVLAFMTGKTQTETELRWLGRDGRRLAAVGGPADYFGGGSPQVSPDGKRAAAAIVDPESGTSDIWVIDLATGTRQRLALDSDDHFLSVWSPDGLRLAVNDFHGGGDAGITVRDADGSAAPEVLVPTGLGNIAPASWSPDGRVLLCEVSTREDERSIFFLRLDGDRQLQPFVDTEAPEGYAQFAPNGRFVAYQSGETGRPEVFIASFPPPGARWQVSQKGGAEPRWSHDGRELFYFDLENQLVAVTVDLTGVAARIAAQQVLFRSHNTGDSYRYDVASDGRFLVNSVLDDEPLSPISVETEWTRRLASR